MNRTALFGVNVALLFALAPAQRLKMGMNSAQAPENARYLLNVLHWLSGTLK
ncbi:MAG TPA: hypothetical protein VLI71_12140 [Gammaproteobacteria bacterium]|nr:hypothetical protein [Gammaproteobacteria bacterium]